LVLGRFLAPPPERFGAQEASFFARWFCFSSGSYSYPSGSCRSNLINAIRWKRNLGAPNLNVREYFSGTDPLPLQNVEQKIAKKTKMMFEFSDHSFCSSFSLFPYVS